MMIEIVSFQKSAAEFYIKALRIRKEVFIEEQKVTPDLEVEYEHESTFYLLFFNDQAVATGRWRATETGLKLERFAVLPAYRNKGIGSALLRKVLSDLNYYGGKIYLHSQLKAIRFYERQGFVKSGKLFYEAGIPHYLMLFNRNNKGDDEK